ncbi:hypothetical protein GCM10022225_21560 [Plantactinospora mayteni]|uniref:Uncharacterized protein n=1 Tax=Plantactinospora mayteni TaxID=566021 RepID=A0ABQ4ENU8_9ACTN|nr:hypothetical protein [Plantactinospora mayteni]GIG96337.1 hypothetical protein Pma05_29100 [Plantactinospora mayteni]
MEITGYDSVLLAPSFEAQMLRTFIDRLAQRWPALLVTVETGGESETQLRWTLRRERSLPATEGWLYLLRDAEMDAYSDDHAYDPMPDGDGPLSVIYRPDRSSGGTQLTLVSPDDPAGHPFSGWAYDLLAECVGVRNSPGPNGYPGVRHQ